MSKGFNYQTRDANKIPENILARMSPEDRASYGYPAAIAPVQVSEPGTVQDQEETPALRKEERNLQEQIRAYLWGQHGIEVIIPPAVKKSALPIGWPDITFSYYGRAIALEVKTKTGKCTSEQTERHQKMRASPNFWIVEVIRGVPEVQAILRRLDDERKNGNGSGSSSTAPGSN